MLVAYYLIPALAFVESPHYGRDGDPFTGRIREVAHIKQDSHMVQLNLSLQLRGKAKRWFELELSHEDKTVLYTPANGVNAWIEALITTSYMTLLP